MLGGRSHCARVRDPAVAWIDAGAKPTEELAPKPGARASQSRRSYAPTPTMAPASVTEGAYPSVH